MEEPRTGSDRPRRRAVGHRRWLGVLLGALVVLLLAEIGVRLIEARLPEPRDWFSPSAARLVREMDAAAAGGATGGFVVAGSSMAGRDLVPDRVVTDPEVPTGSVALAGGGQTTVQERWLTEEVGPRLRPGAVLWGISSLDFNATRRADTIDRYAAARATRTDRFGAADRVLARYSALARNRDALRDPYLMLQVLTGADESDALPDRRGDAALGFARGYREVPPETLARLRAAEAAFARDTQLRGFRIGREEVAAYRRTLRALRRTTDRAVVVIMPVTREYIDAHPNGSRDYERWVRVVTRVAREEGVPLLDETRAMPESAFRDLEHLDEAGAEAFSDRLRTTLDGMGW